jgi:uncharacterized protein (DUF1697 family)
MTTWILLFRGVNVGGRNLLPMNELVQDLRSLEFENVQTYIQSGNAVFRSAKKVSAKITAEIAMRIEKRHGFKPRIVILSADRLENAIRSNPFPEAEAEPNTVHLFFLASPATAADIAALTAAKSRTERFHLTDDVLYLHAPDGIGRSKFAASAERFLGVPATARNWRTVKKLSEMAKAT